MATEGSPPIPSSLFVQLKRKRRLLIFSALTGKLEVEKVHCPCPPPQTGDFILLLMVFQVVPPLSL